MVAAAEEPAPPAASAAADDEEAPPPAFLPPPRRHDKLAAAIAQAEKDAKASAPIKAAKPVAKKRQTAADKAREEDDSWTIQVGAYSQQKQAQIAATEARKALGTLSNVARIVVAQVKSGPGRYRARLTGFTESQTDVACSRIRKKSHHDCSVLED